MDATRSQSAEQAMSPSTLADGLRTSVLEGEVNGPAYGATDVGLPRQRLGVPSVLVNGVGATEGLTRPEPHATTGVDAMLEQRTARTHRPAQHAQTPPTTHSHSQGTQAAAAGDVLLPTIEHVQQRVAVGEVAFSPPEGIPGPDAESAFHERGQPVWIMRLGEFLQRRVTQAGAMMSPLMEARATRSTHVSSRTPLLPPRSWSGAQQPGLFSPEAERIMQQWVSQAPLLHGPQAQQSSESSTGSVTREQILQEVQRQVSREMQAFSQQQAVLERENQRLREA